MNNLKNIKTFKERLNDFSEFKSEITTLINSDDFEKHLAINYVTEVTAIIGKNFEEFDFLDFLNTLGIFSGYITDMDMDLSWSMYDNLQDALYNYTYNRLEEKGFEKRYLDSLEDIYEGCWTCTSEGFQIESKGFLGQVVEFVLTYNALKDDVALEKSLNLFVDSYNF